MFALSGEAGRGRFEGGFFVILGLIEGHPVDDAPEFVRSRGQPFGFAEAAIDSPAVLSRFRVALAQPKDSQPQRPRQPVPHFARFGLEDFAAAHPVVGADSHP